MRCLSGARLKIPRDGAWNMIDKRWVFASPTTHFCCSYSLSIAASFMVPSRISAWAIAIYERQQRFSNQNVSDMIQGLRQCAKDVGACSYLLPVFFLLTVTVFRYGGLRHESGCRMAQWPGRHCRPTAQRRRQVQSVDWSPPNTHRLRLARG